MGYTSRQLSPLSGISWFVALHRKRELRTASKKEARLQYPTSLCYGTLLIGPFPPVMCPTDLLGPAHTFRYLAAHVDQLGPLGEFTLQTLGMALRPVQSVPPETSAIEAVGKMQELVRECGGEAGAGRLMWAC